MANDHGDTTPMHESATALSPNLSPASGREEQGEPLRDFDNAEQKAAQVRMMIFDVDGVLTDGRMQYTSDGEFIKNFYVHDGLGIQLLQKMGIATAIISARLTPIVNKRAADLGIKYVYQGNHDKRITFAQLLADTGIAALECGFMGDDIVDLPLFAKVGFAVSVPNAHLEATNRADYVTKAPGGLGAVREICDFILRSQNKYDAALAPYLYSE